MDMSAPVTRGELREELDRFATKADLERLVTKEFLEERLESMAKKLSEELAQHVRSIEETFRKQLSVFDDKYTDLPGRVKRLEDEVFPDDKPVDRAEHK